MKFVVDNLKPNAHPNICQETKGSILPASQKKLNDKVFFIFDKKTIFTQTIMVLYNTFYAINAIHQYQWFDM